MTSRSSSYPCIISDFRLSVERKYAIRALTFQCVRDTMKKTGGERVENVELTNMCMIVKGDQVLIEERTDKNWPGVAFPGGHVEKGEPFVESVIREVWEETGLTISNPTLRGVKSFVDKGRRYVVFLYEADTFTGELHASVEGDVRWVPRSGLLSMNLAKGMEDTVAFYNKTGAIEIFYDSEHGDWTPRFF